MKWLITLSVAIVLVLSGVSVTAQETEELQCSEADTQEKLESALAMLTDAQSGDVNSQYAAIVQAKTILATVDSVCLGLDFEGTAGTVHGPLYIPEGVYRVRAATSQFFIMTGTILDGDCGDSYDGEFHLFNEFADGEFVAEKVLKSDGCSVLFETSNIFAPYTVTFEKLG